MQKFGEWIDALAIAKKGVAVLGWTFPRRQSLEHKPGRVPKPVRQDELKELFVLEKGWRILAARTAGFMAIEARIKWKCRLW